MLKLDSNLVTLIGTLSGVIIGGIMSYLIQIKTQKRIWIKEHIESMYFPFYEEIMQPFLAFILSDGCRKRVDNSWRF